MNIKTKYNLGDNVIAIVNSNKVVTKECHVCKGKGEVEIPNYGLTDCPECYGSGTISKTEMTGWHIPNDEYYHFKIKKIYTTNYLKQTVLNKDKVQYMSHPNGGTLFKEDNLFLSREEAQAECDKRNFGR